MEPEKCYVGTKIITATEMTECAWLATKEPVSSDRPDRAGYRVTYPDGYVSWSPKETFETAYREVTEGEKALLA